MRSWFFLITLSALTLVACGSTLSNSEEAAVEAGRIVYETGGASGVPCKACHSLDGTDQVGPSLQGIAERGQSRVEGLSAGDYIRQSIFQPSAYVVPGFNDSMQKNYPQLLSEDDINNLIAFLLTQ